mgnify:CR=1 FL=1
MDLGNESFEKSTFNIIEFRNSVRELTENHKKTIELLEQLVKSVEREFSAGNLPFQVREREVAAKAYEEAVKEAERLNGPVQ